MADCPRCGDEGCAWCRPQREVHQMTRRGSPDTSHEAAEKIHKQLTKLQTQVLQCFDDFGAMTDKDLHERCCDRYGQRAYSSYMTRRSELEQAGYIRNTGRRIKQNGTSRSIYERTDKHAATIDRG